MSIINEIETEAKELNIKQVIILRTDLNMRKGKMVAQGSHASSKYMCDKGEIRQLEDGEFFCFKLDAFWKAWLFGNFKKIVQGVNSEEHMHSIFYAVKEAGLPVSLVTDSGLTEFSGIPTDTAIAIGPAPAEIIDKYTGPNGHFASFIKLL